jgi:hypothetical protein
MLSTIEIVLIIIIVIIIALIVYIILRPKKDTKSKSKVQQLINDAISAFGIKISDNFANDIVFNTQSDVIANMSKFSEYAFPGLDRSEIDKILKENGLNKTMTQIFEEHKNDSYDDFNTKFNIIDLLTIYGNIIVEDDNEDEYTRLMIIVIIFLQNLIMKKEINLPIVIPVSPSTSTSTSISSVKLTELYLELSDDFKLNKDIIFYIRTNLNKNIDKKDAVEQTQTPKGINCLINQLCKITVNLDDNYKKIKNIVVNNLNDVKRYTYLSFASSLFELDGTTFPDNLRIELDNLHSKLNTAGLFD